MRFWQLIVPTITWTVIHILVVSVFFPNTPIRFNEELSIVLWFLKSLFLCYCMYVLTYVLFKWNYYLAIVFILISIFYIPFMGFFRCNYMYPCFIFGIIIKKYSLVDNIKSLKTCLMISAFLFFLMLIGWSCSFFEHQPGILSNMIKGNIAPATDYLKKYFYIIIIGFSGSLFFISLFKMVFQKTENNGNLVYLISQYGKYTLGIYALQYIILETIIAKSINIGYVCISIQLLLMPSIALIILILCLCLIKVLKLQSISRKYLLGLK